MTEIGFIAYALLIASPLVMCVIGWGWLVLHGFRNDDVLWGAACFFITPLAFVYGLLNYIEVKLPFWLLTGGTVLFLCFLSFLSLLAN